MADQALLDSKDKDATFGNLYARSALDCVVDVALAVAHDSVKRLPEYAGAAGISKTLRSLRYGVGHAESRPDAKAREAIYYPLFGGVGGKASGQSPFHRFAQAVRDAANKRSERVSTAGEDMLRDKFVDAANDFQSYLLTLQVIGSSDADVDTREEFDLAAAVLKDPGVGGAFSLKPASGDLWPPAGTADGNAGALVEKITRQLQLPVVTQQQFAVLHRIALHGSRVIDGILRGEHQETDPAEVTKEATKDAKSQGLDAAKTKAFVEAAIKAAADADLKRVNALTKDASSWESALASLGK